MDKSFVLQTGFLIIVIYITTIKSNGDILNNDSTIKNNYYSEDVIFNITVDNLLNIFAPISNKITNNECRIQSLFYIKELHKFTLWATQMFDAATKFPNGILVGSTYDLGNFDECLQIDVNVADKNIKGKYCLATIRFNGANDNEHKHSRKLTESPWNLNISTWDRIKFLSEDPSKRARNEIHWAFCIPSACTNIDLQTQIKEVLDQYQTRYNFKASVTVEPHLCQINEPTTLTLGGIVLLLFCAVFCSLIGSATVYDLVTSMQSFKHIKLQGKLHDAMMAFSASKNIKKLQEFDKQENGLDCIHGLKFMSMSLIIMGHRVLFVLGSPILNSDFIESHYSKIESMMLLNGPIVVDSFFNISGFLVSYLLLLEYRKRGRMLNVIMLYVHRLIRLTPAYVFVLAFYCTLFIKVGSGPIWLEKVGVETDRCLSSWWANLLYINNYLHPEKMCMIQSWYLTCDMHLFMISPFIVYLLWKRPTIGKIVLSFCILGSIVIAFCTIYFEKLDALLLLYMNTLRDPLANPTFRKMYIPTHTRASPYFVGMATGYIRYRMNISNWKIPKILVWFGWIAAIFCIEGTVFSAYIFYMPGNSYDPLSSAIYGAFHRITWSIGVSWMIIAMSTGNGAFLEPIFSWKPIITLSRLSYCAFLVHGGLQLYSVASIRIPFYTSFYHLTWYSLGDITLSFIGALFLTITFESPILGLEKILLQKGNKKANENFVANNNNNNNDISAHTKDANKQIYQISNNE